MKIGIYESEVQEMLSAALFSAGLKGGDGLVLFGGKNSDALRLKGCAPRHVFIEVIHLIFSI